MLKLIEGDCLKLLKEIEADSIDCIITDPPYFKVKGEYWDRQWKDPSKFLEWLGSCAQQWQRVLRDNGSLYCFASSQMRARVEILMGEYFNTLPTITWRKQNGWFRKIKKEEQRSYVPQTEAIIFAEQGKCKWEGKCDDLWGRVFAPIREYIVGEYKRAGMLNAAGRRATNKACGVVDMASRHYFSADQWCMPIAEHYQAMRELLNTQGGDFLRKEYEELRKEYEELRRTFNVTVDTPYTDVWDFDTVPPRPGKHPCEKPLDMIEHIVNVSTQPGAVILDCFMGSGTTGIAALNLGRSFIGMELDHKYFEIARERIGESA